MKLLNSKSSIILQNINWDNERLIQRSINRINRFLEICIIKLKVLLYTFYSCINIVSISLSTAESLLSSSSWLLSPSSPASTFQKHLNHFVHYMQASMEASSISLSLSISPSFFFSLFRSFACSFATANARAALSFSRQLLLAAILCKIFGSTHKSGRTKIYVAT